MGYHKELANGAWVKSGLPSDYRFAFRQILEMWYVIHFCGVPWPRKPPAAIANPFHTLLPRQEIHDKQYHPLEPPKGRQKSSERLYTWSQETHTFTSEFIRDTTKVQNYSLGASS